MTRRLIIDAFGRPAPQGSKAYGAVGQMREASRFLAAWRARVKLAALRARAAYPGTWEPADGPVRLDIEFFLGRADGPPEQPTHPLWPIGKPDGDKLARAVADALTEAQVYTDDSRIVEWRVTKRWALAGDRRGARIIVTALDANP